VASDSEATPRFNAFYERYAPGCRDLRVAPLSPEVLLVLLETLRIAPGPRSSEVARRRAEGPPKFSRGVLPRPESHAVSSTRRCQPAVKIRIDGRPLRPHLLQAGSDVMPAMLEEPEKPRARWRPTRPITRTARKR
jgi:hypothetical protein